MSSQTRPRWTDEEDAILRQGYGTVAISALVKRTGRTYKAVCARLQSLGVSTGRRVESQTLFEDRNSQPVTIRPRRYP